MSIRTSIQFRNANDPAYLKAINGAPEDKQEWEDWNGNIEDRPGKEIEGADDVVQETEDEYGGWIIPVKDIPKDATHIVISRG